MIQTAKGPIYFICRNSDAVIDDMSKTIHFRTTSIIEKKGGKNSSNNSTSIFKPQGSSSIVVSYNKKDKSFQ